MLNFPAMRIISLSPSFTDILQELQIPENDLVGITHHCKWTGTKEFPCVGSPKAIDLNVIDRLSPDCLLALEGENRPEQIRELQKRYKVLLFEVRSLPAVMDTIRAIGRLVGRIQESGILEQKIRDQQMENQKVFKDIPAVPTLVLLWNKPYLTVNFDTYISRLVEASGGVNVFHQDPLREFPVEIEDMIEKEPGLLLLPKAPFPFQKRHIADFRKFRIFSSIKIEMIDGKLFSQFGPKTVQALKTVQTILKGLSS